MDTDVLVIGSGLAGMWAALQVAPHARVTVLSKTASEESNTRYAQGGIAAVWSEADSFDDHVRDTLVAGAGLCRREVVEQTVRDGPARVRELIALGAEFTRRDTDPDAYSLHREGGHSHRRILHADDLTGAEVVRTLLAACRQHPNITLLEHHVGVDLITANWLARRANVIPHAEDQVHGAYVLDERSDTVRAIRAPVVVLATGGAGKVYRYTSNPDIATGDGLAMAWRAGARIANMEFVQFHPTSLVHPTEHNFLISEALRGEGGKLVRPDGSRFMPEYDERGELAPRDIVARAIDAELKQRGLDHVYLDMTHLDRARAERMFPHIDSTLSGLGIDMTTTPIPVVPAAHYFCGGVQTDLRGETSVRNLFAVGECACTGVHGANRLASNSLLEGLVFAHHAAQTAVARVATVPELPAVPAWDARSARTSDELVVIQQVWEEIRRFMWNYVGIVRTHRRLKRARRRIALVQEEIRTYYWDFRLTRDLIELRNLAVVADLVVQCALRRRESRGLHYTMDFPMSDDRFVNDTVIQRQR